MTRSLQSLQEQYLPVLNGNENIHTKLLNIEWKTSLFDYMVSVSCKWCKNVYVIRAKHTVCM